MTRAVYAYSDISKITSHPKFEQFKDLPQIAATRGLKEAMDKMYSENEESTIGVKVVQDILSDRWEDSIFQQHVQLGSIMRVMEKEVPEEDRNIFLGFRKNKSEVLRAARQLAEAGVKPDDLCSTCKEEMYFKKIWSQLEQEETSFSDFRTRMKYWEDHPQNMITELHRKIPAITSPKVVLHGFYFIRPLQERIFSILEKGGKELIFLCCISREFPEAGEIWYKSLVEEHGYAPRSEWVFDGLPAGGSAAFCDLFEGNASGSKPDHVKIIKYNDELEFVADVDRIYNQENRIIFSGNVQRTEQMLREYYPDEFKRRHLLAYPVGQYIYCLHSMWDPFAEELDLTIDRIQKCFASGWVCKDGLQGKDYIHELEMLAPYFKNCSTVSKWRERMNCLERSYSDIMSLFEDHIEKNSLKEKKWHRLMGNPFLNLSIFACRPDRMRSILTLLEHLLETAESLFSAADEVSLEDHFTKIEKLLDRTQNEDALLEEEKIIINELAERLGRANSPVKKCFPGDLAEAVMILVGGGFFDEESFSVLADKDADFIRPLYQAEETPAKGPCKVHLCMCDEESVPGKAKGNPWPISDAMIENLTGAADECGRKCLWDIKFIASNNPLCIRYLFATLLLNEDVELSWIIGGDPKEMAPSPYIKLLESMYSLKPLKVEVHSVTEEEARSASPLERDTNITFPVSSPVPAEVKYDLALCPFKYLYGYVLQEFPTYSSDFHYSFIISSMIGAFSTVSGMSKKAVSQHLHDLMPYHRNIEFRQMSDFAGKPAGGETDELENISYSSERLRVHFLKTDILNNAKASWEAIQRSGHVHKAELARPAQSKETCKFCQHSGLCVSALYAADEENENGN